MVKAAKLRDMVYEHEKQEAVRDCKIDVEAEKKLKQRKNLIPEEIKRLERILIETAQNGRRVCLFSLGSLYCENYKNDPVQMAIFKYCEENELKCIDISYQEPVGFHEEIYKHLLKIKW